jgi:phage gp45-like
MQIRIGYINKTSEGGSKAQVTTLQDEVIDDVLLLYPYGFASNIQNDDNSSVLLFSSMGSDTNIFGIPYNPPLQPVLESQETAIGNFKGTNKITFKANGDIEIIAENVDITATELLLSGLADITGDINTDGVYKVNDVQVVSTQGASVPDASGGVVIDVEARAAINSLLARLRIHGLIAP